MEKPIHRDVFGREINVGDYIAYGAVDGRSGVIRIGQVIKLIQRPIAEPKYLPPGISRHPQYELKLSAKALDVGWPKAVRQKDVTLTFMRRIVVLDSNTIPQEHKDLLDGPIKSWSDRLG